MKNSSVWQISVCDFEIADVQRHTGLLRCYAAVSRLHVKAGESCQTLSLLWMYCLPSITLLSWSQCSDRSDDSRFNYRKERCPTESSRPHNLTKEKENTSGSVDYMVNGTVLENSCCFWICHIDSPLQLPGICRRIFVSRIHSRWHENWYLATEGQVTLRSVSIGECGASMGRGICGGGTERNLCWVTVWITVCSKYICIISQWQWMKKVRACV